MRTKGKIEQDGTKVELLLLEVLLDCRSLLEKLVKKNKKKT